MIPVPRVAMVQAAGLGTRMRPLTLQTPKPLLKVGGKALIDHVLDRLSEGGVRRAVVNLHHFPDQVRQHLVGRTKPEVVFSDESAELLNTGGSLARARPLLTAAPFYIANSDMIWRDWQGNALHRLAERWEDKEMDALLLLQSCTSAIGYAGLGDFTADAAGRLTWRDERSVAPFVYTGLQLLHPRLLDNCPAGPFPMRLLWDRALEAGRFFGIRHDGDWMEVGTPDQLATAEAAQNG